MSPAWAKDEPPIGTFPAGSTGNSVFVGLTMPRTGTYAVQGEDELKGCQLAIEHINSGHPLIKAISPKTTKGVLGKEVKYGVADDEAKPNSGVQNISRFITENKAVVMMGGTSSAVAVALNKLAQREKVIFLSAVSGSNDTTGKDCVRYGFRECSYGQTAAAGLGPVLLKEFGKGKKAAYLTPDYTYGHTVQKSMSEFLNKEGGWTTVTNQVCPLGAPDYSSFLLNIANSGADVFLNINWGHDAVLSIQQAKQFGVLDKQKLVVPYQVPFLAREVGGDMMDGVLCARPISGGRSRTSIRSPRRSSRSSRRSTATPEWGAHVCYLQFALWAKSVEAAGTFYPVEVIKAYEKGSKMQSTIGEVYFRAEDHQIVRPIPILRGKKAADMKNKEDF